MRRPLTRDQIERKAALVAHYEAERATHLAQAQAAHEAMVADLVRLEQAEQQRQLAEARDAGAREMGENMNDFPDGPVPTGPMPPRLHPITLTPQEYQLLVNELAARDPLVRFLMSKQEAAAQMAARATGTGLAGDPRPSGQPELRSPAFDYAFGKAPG